MKTALWAVLLALGVLWPAHLAGPLDGAPLDQPVEVILAGLLLPLLLLVSRTSLARPAVRIGIAVLLAWKAFSATALTQDGWCARFVTPAPLFRDMGLVPHTWDVRADWSSTEPTCAAIVDRPYASFEQFPVWFYNLPPVGPDIAQERDRPPYVTLNMSVTGALHVTYPGKLNVAFGDDMRSTILVDDRDRTSEIDRGIDLDAGTHSIAIASELHGSRWRFQPTWDGGNLWSSSAMATLTPTSTLDQWLRPWARFVPLLLIIAISGGLLLELIRTIADARLLLIVATAVACLAVGGGALPVWARSVVTLLLPLALFTPVPERLRGSLGFGALIAAPWLAFFAWRSAIDAGAITIYTSGDDWWMFQRFAYRIFLQGYWLEGGQITFWFQPLYRWIAGALHVLFGDSSVGELLWDAWCVLAGSFFAFTVVKAASGFRWAMAAGATTVLVFVVGPAWYLFGRGLSEISSAGLIYLAAILALRAQEGDGRLAVLAGIAGTLAFYTRLNNLPMVLALVAFALPLSIPVTSAWQIRSWWNAASRPVAAAILGAIAIGLWFFTWRTYHYTGVPDMLYGTQSGALGVWQHTTEGLTPLQNVIGSVLMVLTMNDPPRFDVRALPVVIGVIAAVLGLLRVRIARRLPLNVVALCLAGVAGAFVARGSAYPGRFSVHIIPVAIALTFILASRLIAPRNEVAQ